MTSVSQTLSKPEPFSKTTMAAPADFRPAGAAIALVSKSE